MDTQLEVLIEIRDLLKEINEKIDPSICPHGSRGFCMYCVQPAIDQIAYDVRRNLNGGTL